MNTCWKCGKDSVTAECAHCSGNGNSIDFETYAAEARTKRWMRVDWSKVNAEAHAAGLFRCYAHYVPDDSPLWRTFARWLVPVTAQDPEYYQSP